MFLCNVFNSFSDGSRISGGGGGALGPIILEISPNTACNMKDLDKGP